MLDASERWKNFSYFREPSRLVKNLFVMRLAVMVYCVFDCELGVGKRSIDLLKSHLFVL